MKRAKNKATVNSGFSLVELIVVVLIMGILAVGLTPQVMKWVNNARKASDIQYMHSLESAVSYALMNTAVNEEVIAAVGGGEDVVLVVDESGTNPADGKDVTQLLIKTAESLGFSSSAEDMNRFKKNKIKTAGGVIRIHINSGHAIGEFRVNGSEVDFNNE